MNLFANKAQTGSFFKKRTFVFLVEKEAIN